MASNKKKVVLFFPAPSRAYPWTRLPLSILTAGSLLPKFGYQPVFISAKNKDWKDELVREAEDAIFVGISAMTGYQITEGLEAAQLIKTYYPHIRILWGGRHPTILPVDTVHHPLVDMVVKGQGERVVVELADCLTKGPLEDINLIKGLTHKTKHDIIQNEDRPLEDPNNFPYYPYHLMNVSDYVFRSEMGDRTINYVSSIGCPHRCRFCAEVAAFKSKWRGLRPERVLSEWKNLSRNYKIEGIVIDDSNYFVDKERVLAIANGLLKDKISIRYGFANAHVNEMLRFNDEEWKILKMSGLYGILIGAESGSDEALKAIQKDATVEGLIRVVEKCKKFGIKANLSFMVGLPRNEAFKIPIEKEIADILKLIQRCYAISHNIEGLIFFYTPYPGSPFYLEALKQGMKEPQSLEEWAKIELNVPHMPLITKKISRLVSNVNRSWHYLFMHYMKTPEYDGHKIRKGKTVLRMAGLRGFETLGYWCAIVRWKFLFFGIPLEHVLIGTLTKFSLWLMQIKKGNLRNSH